MGARIDSLVSFMENLEYPERHIILSDLAGSRHGYPANEAINAYRNALAVSESIQVDDFTKEIIGFIEGGYRHLRQHLGADAMLPISEEESEHDREVKKEIDKKESEGQKKFEKEAEKRKKSEQAPIAKAVRAKGQSQDDMADAVDVDKSTISRWKTGTRKPNFDNLKDLKSQYGAGLINQLLGA